MQIYMCFFIGMFLFFIYRNIFINECITEMLTILNVATLIFSEHIPRESVVMWSLEFDNIFIQHKFRLS